MKKFPLLLLAGALVIAGLYFWLRPPAAVEATLRRAPAGDLIGFAESHNTYAWLGIPFAKPPVGDLRWRAPRALPRWEGVKQALSYGDVCPQLQLSPGDSHAVQGDEDCLTLNIWTPRLSAVQIAQAKLPVMVWIHGGGNTMGSSRMGAGYHLAGSQNVIVISINYRLGVLGWLSHPALRANASPEDASGNYGLLDQIAALRWVQTNIATFGGDPGNVTIFGESGGARDVLALLATQPAQGLFQRAIAQSGSMRTIPRAAAENFRDDANPGLNSSSRELINHLLIAQGAVPDRTQAKARQQQMSDIEMLAWLRGKSPAELLAVVKRGSFALYDFPTNLRDGAVLPEQSLFTVLADPTRHQRVPVIIGSNRDESKLFLSTDPDLVDMRWGFLPKIKDLATYNRINAYFSDSWKALGVDEPAIALNRAGVDVFVYRFDWDEAPNYGFVDMHDWLGAAHGLDVPFVLGEGATSFPFMTSRDNKAGRAMLTEQMMGYWAQFARTGNPDVGGQAVNPRWDRYVIESPQQMVFATNKNGGVRMDASDAHPQQIKWRLLDDARLSVRERCEMYVQLFLINFQSDEFWSESEYHALGCAGYPPNKVTSAY